MMVPATLILAPNGQAAPRPRKPPNPPPPPHPFYPQMRHEAREANVAAASQTTPLVWNGGRIQDTTNIVAIYWLPSGYHYETGTAATAAGDYRYSALIDRYFKDVNGSTFYNPTTQ